MNGLILVLNCGSSSIKFALFPADEGLPSRQAAWQGKVEGITGTAPTIVESDQEATDISLDAHGPYHDALAHIVTRAQAWLQGRRLVAVAHRVVHGGERYVRPVRVDAQVLSDLRSYIPLAPLHQPFALEAIGILLAQDPDLPQIACFDTAFHHTLPAVERMLPLPCEVSERGVRRYGFHGLSYEYQSIVLPERHGELARGRTIVAHLGSGASLCGMIDLQSTATTMGFSALEGLMMGTRTGSIDPGVLLYLMEVEQLSVEQVGQMLYHRSGLLGVSGLSGDPRVLLQQEQDHARARDALALYVRRIIREVGGMAAVLGGLDLLVFTAGIGEHNAELRQRICQGLSFLGLSLEKEANARHAPVISQPGSRVRVAVEPTNEEWVAARHAMTSIRHV